MNDKSGNLPSVIVIIFKINFFGIHSSKYLHETSSPTKEDPLRGLEERTITLVF
jgi:hypothetical protein